MGHDDSRAGRRAGFLPGVEVRLSDGTAWTLPRLPPGSGGAEFEALVAALSASEGRDDDLRAGLALTIFLLGWNYDLPAEALAFLLGFPPGDPGLPALQDAVHRLMLGPATRASRPGAPGADRAGVEGPRGAGPARPTSWAARLRSIKPFRPR